MGIGCSRQRTSKLERSCSGRMVGCKREECSQVVSRVVGLGCLDGGLAVNVVELYCLGDSSDVQLTCGAGGWGGRRRAEAGKISRFFWCSRKICGNEFDWLGYTGRRSSKLIQARRRQSTKKATILKQEQPGTTTPKATQSACSLVRHPITIVIIIDHRPSLT